MEKDMIKILAIESSCDETAAAVIGVENGQPVILSSVVASQIDLHTKTGGVVPEVASRAHMEAIMPVIEQALQEANSKKQEILRLAQDPFGANPKSPPLAGQIQNSKLKNFDIENSLKIEKFKLQNSSLLGPITHIAVTAGPGLIGSLLVGFNAARAIAYAKNLPIIPITHIEGHIYSAFGEANHKKQEILRLAQDPFGANPKSPPLAGSRPTAGQIQNSKLQNFDIENLLKIENCKIAKFPLLALTVSGGHTSLTLMRDHGKYETLGETIDDAAGEAFDKVAKLLDLGYPGGPIVSKFANEFRKRIMYQESGSRGKNPNTSYLIPNTIIFPRPLLNKPNFDFSFSGLKTAVLTKVLQLTADGLRLTADQKEEICWAFEEAVVDVLCTKTIRAVEKYQPKTVILAGGVAANKRLREELSLRLKTYDLRLILPPLALCGDNAAMIGIAAYYHILRGDVSDPRSIIVDSNLKI